MKPRIGVTAVLAFSFALTQILPAKNTTSSPTSAAVTVVVLGSSTAAGTGPSNPNNAWVNRYRVAVQNIHPGSQVINLAVGGYTTYHIMPDGFSPPPGRPAPDPNSNITKALSFNPTWIIINLPSNDAAQGYPVNEQLSNYDAALALATAQGVPVWISTTQPRNLSASGRRNLITMRDSTFSRYGQKAIDFWDRLAFPNGEIRPKYDSGDGVHLNDAGHEILFLRARQKTLTPPGRAEQSSNGKPATLSTLNSTVDEFTLLQNYPNPFNPTTTIEFMTETDGVVELAVFNTLGQRIKTLANRNMQAGQHRVIWDATDDFDTAVSSGLYFYRLQAANFVETRRLMLLR